jgi:predicted ATPase
MALIREVEVAYFRSFYKVSLNSCSALNVIFGKNDAGKSNLMRALNLFFNESTDSENYFNFDIDFNDKRRSESNASEDVRKFFYVKVTFNTPPNYKKSLGETFYVKRQWTVSRGDDFVETMSDHIKSNQRHIVTRFMNLITFMYVPAIKDVKIFEKLLKQIYEVISESDDFSETMKQFSARVQESTKGLFADLPDEIAYETKISSPRRMDELFQTLDFETKTSNVDAAKSLTLQRGDGIKVRHIPELLRFIAEKDSYQFHIWGFEEPENSLDFVSAEAEARRFLSVAKAGGVQVFMTTHSPSFYNLTDNDMSRYYVRKDVGGGAEVVQGKALSKIDVNSAVGEGFYLPAVAAALEQYSEQQGRIAQMQVLVDKLQLEIEDAHRPVVLTEGTTDKSILEVAWKRLRGKPAPFLIKCCDTMDGLGGGAGGAEKLAMCLKSVRADSGSIVFGVFDRDKEGAKWFAMDGNFLGDNLFADVKVSKNKKSYATILPIPKGREDYALADNLPIEFMFADTALEVKVDGKGLELEPIRLEHRIGGKTIAAPTAELHWARKIVSASKKHFADKVVPSLAPEEFAPFEPLFASIEKAIEIAEALKAKK